MHFWGNEFKYFSEVEEAAQFIGQYCRKYGRINVTQTKEKFGTARVYCDFGLYNLFSITHPGHHYNHIYPNWLIKLDYCVFSKIIKLFNPLFVHYQFYIYRKAYEAAFKKWPLIKEEIISGADYSVLVSEYFEAISFCDKHREALPENFSGRILYSTEENCEVCKGEKK